MSLVHFKLKDQSPPLLFFLPEKHGKSFQLMLEKDGKRLEARYCDNEPSIFVKDQNKKSRSSKIKFTNGSLTVDSDLNPTLVTFLESHPLFGKAFEKIDPEAEARKQIP